MDFILDLAPGIHSLTKKFLKQLLHKSPAICCARKEMKLCCVLSVSAACQHFSKLAQEKKTNLAWRAISWVEAPHD